MESLFSFTTYKRIVCSCLFIILFFTLTTLKAQTTFKPVFGNYNSTWNVYAENLIGNWTDSFFTAGDTIINSLQYKIVKSKPLSEPTVYLRSDSSNSKLWSLTFFYYFLPPAHYINEEHLLMDISLGIGDSLYIHSPSGVDGYFYVDSVYSYQGRKRVRINHFYSAIREKLTFIEGIGPNAGLDYQDTLHGINLSPYLLCKHDSDSLVYSSILFNHQCDIEGDGIKSIKNGNELMLLPNPVNSYLQLSNLPTQKTNLHYTIINTLGQIKQSNTLTPNNTLANINVSALLAGIYFIRLTDNKSFVYSAKFVKE